jgi:hypothetical protein
MQEFEPFPEGIVRGYTHLEREFTATPADAAPEQRLLGFVARSVVDEVRYLDAAIKNRDDPICLQHLRRQLEANRNWPYAIGAQYGYSDRQVNDLVEQTTGRYYELIAAEERPA